MELEKIVERLEALEETIIFKLLNRAQYRQNQRAYQKGESGFPDQSLFEARLNRQEQLDAEFGRFTVPEERPFTANLPEPKRIGAQRNTIYLPDFNVMNLTGEILPAYFSLLGVICAEGDDGHYGSTVEHDVEALRAISERIHFGACYVAECKFQEDPVGYRRLIQAHDKLGLMEKLSRPDVEAEILRRVEWKAQQFQNGANSEVRHVVNPKAVVDFYRNHIIPLTKKGELLYLLKRK